MLLKKKMHITPLTSCLSWSKRENFQSSNRLMWSSFLYQPVGGVVVDEESTFVVGGVVSKTQNILIVGGGTL